MSNLATTCDAWLAVTVSDVTSTVELDAELPNDLSGRDAAQAIAALMLLPEDDWVLRDNATGAYVMDEDRVGDILSAGASVTLTTRAHLGGSA